MLHGQRRTLLPQQWQQQIASAAHGWADIRRRHETSKARQQAHHSRLWEGYSAGSIVILGPDITKASYGLDLCDDNGESILMDGEIMQIEGEFAMVKIGRHQGKAAPGRGPMVGELQRVRRSDIIRISDKPPTLWGNAKQAMAAAAQRDGRQRGNNNFWVNG